MGNVSSNSKNLNGTLKKNKTNILLGIFVVIFLIIIGYFVVKYCFIDNVTPFVSQYDGQNYQVRKVGDDINRQTAANYLALINSKINTIVYYMHKHKLPDPDTAKRLYYRWLQCDLKETNSHERSAAYTLNKSAEIRLCIRDADGNFENPNTSMFVILHELAHVMSVSYGHDEEFKNNFSYITHLASNLGVYKPEDFNNSPKTYCNTIINTSPCNENTCSYNILKL